MYFFISYAVYEIENDMHVPSHGQGVPGQAASHGMASWPRPGGQASGTPSQAAMQRAGQATR